MLSSTGRSAKSVRVETGPGSITGNDAESPCEEKMPMLRKHLLTSINVKTPWDCGMQHSKQ